MTEDQIQAEFYREAFNRYPQIRGLLFSVPNGSTRHVLEALKLKATGLTPGIPDMILMWPKPTGFEFKSATGSLSPVQQKIRSTWQGVGIDVHVCRSSEEALLILKNILCKTTADTK